MAFVRLGIGRGPPSIAPNDAPHAAAPSAALAADDRIK